MTHVCMAVTVWGNTYVEEFLDFSLPSLLAQGNVPALGTNGTTYEMQIWTSEGDVARLDGSAQLVRLRELMPVHIRGFPDFLFAGGSRPDRYSRMSSLHRGIIQHCQKQDAGIMFLPSDVVWADNSLRNIEAVIEDGKRVVALCALRSHGDRLLAPLAEFTDETKDGQKIISIEPRRLVELVLSTQHPETLSRYHSSDNFTTSPAHIYWELGGQGVLARTLHLHPVYVHPVNYDVEFKTTFDADFLRRAVPNLDDYYVCDDSDLMFFSDLTDPTDLDTVPDYPNMPNELQIAQWMTLHTDPTHRTFLNTPIWIHTGINKSEWRQTERHSDLFTKKMLAYCEALEDQALNKP